MKRSSLVAGVCCLALVSSNTVAAAEGLGLQMQLHFGGQSAPQRMELALQAPRALLGRLADQVEAGSLNAPLLTSEWQHGKTRTSVLGVPLGIDPQAWRLNADETESRHTWVWVGAAVVGATLLAVGLSGGGGKRDDETPTTPSDECSAPSGSAGGPITVVDSDCLP